MLKARRQLLPLRFFAGYFRILQKIIFRGVNYNLSGQIPDGPVLLVQNHFSWWDGYWSYHISENILKRKFHVMMLEPELQKRKFLTRAGAFSVNPEGKEMLASIRHACDLLKSPDNVLTIYPQGKIRSHYISQVEFEKGLEVLLRYAGSPVHVVFVAAHIRFGSPARPHASLDISYFGTGKYALGELQEAYNIFYTRSREIVISQEI